MYAGEDMSSSIVVCLLLLATTLLTDSIALASAASNDVTSNIYLPPIFKLRTLR